MAVLAAVIPAVSLLLSGPSAPVPVQRPTGLDAPADDPAVPAPEAEPEAPQEPAPAEAPASEPAAPEAEAPAVPEATVAADDAAPQLTVAESAANGSIVGTLIDTETEGAPITDTRVDLMCTCLDETQFAVSDARGFFQFDDLPPGVYTVVTTRGGRPSSEVVAVGDGDSPAIELAVGPPTNSDELEDRAFIRHRAQTMIAAGAVAELAALVMLLAAAIEQRKPECDFGLDDCADAPRPAVTTGLGVGGGILAAGGAVLIGVGVHRLRKLNARIQASDRGLALTISGRF